jgi:hypothetical protein
MSSRHPGPCVLLGAEGVLAWIVMLLIVHMAVRVWTVVCFAPTIFAFQSMPYSATIDPVLVEKAAQ